MPRPITDLRRSNDSGLSEQFPVEKPDPLPRTGEGEIFKLSRYEDPMSLLSNSSGGTNR
jgi:hypothetical protein